MTLFGFGTATVDFRIQTADLGPEYRAKLLAQKTEVMGGGAVANALYQATLLGGKTEWIGRLGSDGLGDMIIEDLNSHGIGTRHVRRIADAYSPFNLAAYAGEGRRRLGGFLLPNCLGGVTDDDIEAWVQALCADDWILVEVGEIPLPTVLAFCRAAKSSVDPAAEPTAPGDRPAPREGSGPRIVVDVDLDPIRQCVGGDAPTIDAILALADVILPNREAMESLYPGYDAAALAAELAAKYAVPVVVTAGDQGCSYARGELPSVPPGSRAGRVAHVPAAKVDVVDTVGAGDAFHGAFAWALANGEGLDSAVRVATICAAANCRAFGARSGMIGTNELDGKMGGVT